MSEELKPYFNHNELECIYKLCKDKIFKLNSITTNKKLKSENFKRIPLINSILHKIDYPEKSYRQPPSTSTDPLGGAGNWPPGKPPSTSAVDWNSLRSLIFEQLPAEEADILLSFIKVNKNRWLKEDRQDGFAECIMSAANNRVEKAYNSAYEKPVKRQVSVEEIEKIISFSNLWKYQVTRPGLQRDKRHLAQAIHAAINQSEKENHGN